MESWRSCSWRRGRAYYYRGVVRMHRFGNVPAEAPAQEEAKAEAPVEEAPAAEAPAEEAKAE